MSDSINSSSTPISTPKSTPTSTPTSFLPGKNERRGSTFQKSFADAHSLIQIFDDQRSRGPIAQAQSRHYLIGVLDRQYQLSQERGYPICLTLATIYPSGEIPAPAPDAILHAVAKICRSNLRPTDLVFRYAEGLLAMIMLESDEDGGASVADRLRRCLDRRLYFGKTALSVRPVFAVSDMSIGFGSAGRSLLTSAELVLKKAEFNTTSIALASHTLNSASSSSNMLKAQEIANAITGMFDTIA